jgi:hypothetical protein
LTTTYHYKEVYNMTEQVMRRLLGEALDLSAVEEALKELIRENLDPAAVAQEIWDTWQD